MTIRSATVKDVPRLLELYYHLYDSMANLEPGYCKIGLQSADFLKEIILGETSHLYVSEIYNTIVGFVLLTLEETPPYPIFVHHRYCFLMDLVVDPEFRSKGIGAHLLTQAKTWAKEQNADFLELHVLSENKRAIELYEREGLRKVVHTMRMDL